ncbi:hypothetical protein [Polaromonas sp.]|uniref:hypothetical protein n=1 Tax=Polaromonas sp. TaxID=1869339 RepID=UPI003751F513
MNVSRFTGFFSRRWHGQVPLRLLFWRDMLLVGTGINLAAAFVVLMLMAQGVSLGLAIALHFSLVPYNLFLTLAVWRSRQGTLAMTLVAVLWLVFFTLV